MTSPHTAAILAITLALAMTTACASSESELVPLGPDGQPIGQDAPGAPNDWAGPGGQGTPGAGGVTDDGLPIPAGGFEEACTTPEAPEDRVFERALCLCGDLADVGQGLRTRSFSRTFGMNEGEGHVGINGVADIVGYANVSGDLDVGETLKGLGKVTAEGDMSTGGDFGGLGSYAVLGDARVNGNLGGIGYVKVLGDLYLNGDQLTLGVVNASMRAGGFAWSGPPCGCDAGAIIDVAAEVERHRGANNNDALPTGGVGFETATLTTGDYFFDRADALIGAAKITIDGRVRVFLADDLDTLGHLAIELAEYAELELWVKGSVRTVGNIKFADDEQVRARAFKLYVGGAESAVVNVGNARFYGAIYAPRADIGFVGNLQVYGSVFANNINGAGNLDIFYDTDVTVPDICIDAYPDPVIPQGACKDDTGCPGAEICDPLTHECRAEDECKGDTDCSGNDRCISGECVVL